MSIVHLISGDNPTNATLAVGNVDFSNFLVPEDTALPPLEQGKLLSIPNGLARDLYYSDGVSWLNLSSSSGGANAILVGATQTLTTITAGIAAAVALLPTRAVVLVDPGTYVEANPMIVPDGISVVSLGERLVTTIVAATPASDLITLGNGCLLSGFSLAGTDAFALTFDGAAGSTSGSLVTNCLVIGCANGFKAINQPAELVVVDSVIRPTSAKAITDAAFVTMQGTMRLLTVGIMRDATSLTITNGLRCDQATSTLVMQGGGINNAINGIVTENSGTVELKSIFIEDCVNATVVQGASPTLMSHQTTIHNSVTSDLLITSLTATVRVHGGMMRDDRIVNDNNVTIQAMYFSGVPGDAGLNVLGELRVGSAEQPSESVFGSGDDHTTGMCVLTTDAVGANFLDVSAAMVDPAVVSNAFQGVAPGHILYVGGKTLAHGLKINTAVAMPAINHHSIVIEYYNGAVWAPFKIMLTDNDPPFYTRNDDIFETVGTQHMRDGTMPGWVASVVNTITKFWIRFRVVIALTALPTLNQIKLGSNRTEFHEDGSMAFFGDARPVDTLNWSVGALESASAAVNSSDIFVSTNLDLKRKDNLMTTAAISRVGTNGYLPPQLDTSRGIKLTWAWFSPLAAAGNITWIVRWGFTNDIAAAVSSNVYDITALAPAIGANEQSITIISAYSGVANKQQTTSINLDTHLVNPFPQGRVGDVFWFTLERNGLLDLFAGDVALIQLHGTYVRTSMGGHIMTF